MFLSEQQKRNVSTHSFFVGCLIKLLRVLKFQLRGHCGLRQKLARSENSGNMRNLRFSALCKALHKAEKKTSNTVTGSPCSTNCICADSSGDAADESQLGHISIGIQHPASYQPLFGLDSEENQARHDQTNSQFAQTEWFGMEKRIE